MTPSLQPRSSRSVPWCSPLPPCGLSAESVLPESSIGGAAHTTILPMYHSGHNYQLTPKELAWQREDGRTPDLNQHAGGRSRGVDHHDDRVLTEEGIAGRLRGAGAGDGKLGDIPVFRRASGERVAVELHNVLEGKVGLDVDLDDTHQVVTPRRLAGRDSTEDDRDVAGKADGKGGPEVELTEHEPRGQGEHDHPHRMISNQRLAIVSQPPRKDLISSYVDRTWPCYAFRCSVSTTCQKCWRSSGLMSPVCATTSPVGTISTSTPRRSISVCRSWMSTPAGGLRAVSVAASCPDGATTRNPWAAASSRKLRATPSHRANRAGSPSAWIRSRAARSAKTRLGGTSAPVGEDHRDSSM